MLTREPTTEQHYRRRPAPITSLADAMSATS